MPDDWRDRARLSPAKPTKPKPIMAQVLASGTAVMTVPLLTMKFCAKVMLP